MRIMAIDYGDAHTGVALSDPTGFLVGTTTTINSWRQEVVVDRLAQLIFFCDVMYCDVDHGASFLCLA